MSDWNYVDPDPWFDARIPSGDFSNRRMTREEWLHLLSQERESFQFWTHDFWRCVLKASGEVLFTLGLKRIEILKPGGEAVWRWLETYALPVVSVVEVGVSTLTVVDCGPKFYREFKRIVWGYDTISRRDPLVLDLNGDGIKTTDVTGLTYFDYNGDGFYEQTGWIDWNDGLLVMDRNGNGIIDDGKELFGDETILETGQRARNGFEALGELDSNKDGRIDSGDALFSQLRVLKYADEEGN